MSTARPGHSEHQLGTAIDVLEPGVGELTADFAATPAAGGSPSTPTSTGSSSAIPTVPPPSPATSSSRGTCATSGANAAAVVDSGVPLREWLFDRASADDSSG